MGQKLISGQLMVQILFIKGLRPLINMKNAISRANKADYPSFSCKSCCTFQAPLNLKDGKFPICRRLEFEHRRPRAKAELARHSRGAEGRRTEKRPKRKQACLLSIWASVRTRALRNEGRSAEKQPSLLGLPSFSEAAEGEARAKAD